MPIIQADFFLSLLNADLLHFSTERAMPYSDFTLDKAVDLLGVEIRESADLFTDIPTEPIPDFLTLYFSREFAISTASEMGRREMYVAPILNEVFGKQPRRFTIFSGENFDVDKSLQLKGLADYLISLSPVKAYIHAPVIAVAETKRNDPVDGLGQCVSELYASALFNERKNHRLPRLFGVATNGESWIFGDYIAAAKVFTYDPVKYPLQDLARIVSILSYMRDEALKMNDLI